MRQDDALSAAPCFDSTTTKFPLAGAVSLNHRNKEPLSAPYKVRNGKVHFEAGEYLQVYYAANVVSYLLLFLKFFIFTCFVVFCDFYVFVFFDYLKTF